MGEGAGPVFDHQAVDDRFEVSLAVVWGEKASEKEDVQCLEKEGGKGEERKGWEEG